MTKNNRKTKDLKLPKVVGKSKKRVGRGYGSGKGGHTVGRGVKGQKSRGDLHILFEGIKVKKSLLRRLPLQRGKGKLKSQTATTIINLSDLNKFKEGATVDLESLIEQNLITEKDASNTMIKILNNGKLTTKKLKVKVPTTKSAAVQIEKALGTIN